MPGSRAAGGTAVVMAGAGNWECCATLVSLQPCYLPSHLSFAPADTGASVEPVGKVLLSKPPLATAQRRQDQPSRGAAKGSGHALSRTRGKVLFPWAVLTLSGSFSPPKTHQLLPGSLLCSSYLCPDCTHQPGHRALLQPRTQLSAPSAPLERSHGSSQCPLTWGSPTAALRAAPMREGPTRSPRALH